MASCNGICHHPCSSKQVPRALQQFSMAPSLGSAHREENIPPPYCICGVRAASLHYSQQGCFANLALLTTSLGLEGLVLLLVQPAKQGEMYSVVFFRHTGLKFCLEH